jgi:hypothetical protein
MEKLLAEKKSNRKGRVRFEVKREPKGAKYSPSRKDLRIDIVKVGGLTEV